MAGQTAVFDRDELVLDIARRDDDQAAAVDYAGIPGGVNRAFGDEDQAARPGGDLFVDEPEHHLPLGDVKASSVVGCRWSGGAGAPAGIARSGTGRRPRSP